MSTSHGSGGAQELFEHVFVGINPLNSFATGENVNSLSGTLLASAADASGPGSLSRSVKKRRSPPEKNGQKGCGAS